LLALWWIVIWLRPDAFGGAFVKWAGRLGIMRVRPPATGQSRGPVPAVNAAILAAVGVLLLYRG